MPTPTANVDWLEVAIQRDPAADREVALCQVLLHSVGELLEKAPTITGII